MSSGRKIRNLVKRDGVDISLEDVILAVNDVTEELFDLEHRDRKTSLRKAKKKLIKAGKLLDQFKKRINGEVTEDVFFGAKQKNVNYKGNPDSLPNINKQINNTDHE